jgi:acetyl esterase/lipase
MIEKIKDYKAPKPRYSAGEWFKFIALRTIFPPVLVWDLLKLGMNKAVGELAGGAVLPAQNRFVKNIQSENTQASPSQTCKKYTEIGRDDNGKIIYIPHTVELEGKNLTYKECTVITHDGAHLDTFEIKHSSQNEIDPQHQKYIINLVGNGMCYEEIIPAMQRDANDLEANVVGFNFRGVSQSTSRAKSKDDLVIDGIAQVQRLLEQGVSPQNIILKGHSLGAGVASLVALHFHQLGQPINLFNSRSFSSITNVLTGAIRL